MEKVYPRLEDIIARANFLAASGNADAQELLDAIKNSESLSVITVEVSLPHAEDVDRIVREVASNHADIKVVRLDG